MLTPPVLAAQQFQALQGGASQRRRLTGGVDIGAGELHQGFDQVVTAGDKGTGRTESLAQGADQYLHIIQAQAEVLDNAAAGGAQWTKTVGIIDHHPGIGTARFSAQ